MYELTDTGRAMAKRLKLYARTLVESGPLRQLPDTTVDEEFGMVTMSMDFREGGGGGKSLHRYCDELDRYALMPRMISSCFFFTHFTAPKSRCSLCGSRVEGCRLHLLHR